MTRTLRPATRGTMMVRRVLSAGIALAGLLVPMVVAAPGARAVVGGTAATRGRFPFIVTIQRGAAQYSRER
ncbi:hypothetical protein ACIPLC_28980 [Kitasatospora sp. NPDC086801]|uniref:hypothetical protein n=1 Tax=Kitasatospora sp. NPDC086801 TaxID=3364066 RepID=UPI00380A91AA